MAPLMAPESLWKSRENVGETESADAKQNIQSRSTNSDMKIEGVPYHRFRNVTEISSRVRAATSGPAVDMAKALKGMAAVKVQNVVDSISGALPRANNSIIQEKQPFQLIQVDKTPLDLSLKTSMRILSSKSFKWCHKVSTRNQISGLRDFISLFQSYGNSASETSTSSSDGKGMIGTNVEASFWKAFHSWVHPQAVLPPSVLSALASSAARGGVAESTFLSKRQQTWEDSFRSLYYTFRNKLCDLFYFCTQQFVVMFIGGGLGGRSKKACSAYLTKSTRGLRGLLQEQDITFSMPLCTVEAGTATIEELQELTEFEKANPGQTRLVDSMLAVDNSIQSLLAFIGSKSVHGLYDFLLNHRSLIHSTTGSDVPLLYSPVPFQNAAIVVPEVSCKQMQRGDTVAGLYGQNDVNTTFCLEIKGSPLLPWVICRICSAIQQSHPESFEASFVTDPLSEGLNIAQENNHNDLANSMNGEDAVVTSELSSLAHSAAIGTSVIKHLKFTQGVYVTIPSRI